MNKTLAVSIFSLLISACSSIPLTHEQKYDMYTDFCFEQPVPKIGEVVSMSIGNTNHESQKINEVVSVKKEVTARGYYTCDIRGTLKAQSVSKIAYEILEKTGFNYQVKENIKTETVRDFTYKINLKDRLNINSIYESELRNSGVTLRMYEMVEGDIPTNILNERK